MELLGGVDLLVDILLRLEVDGLKGRLRASVSRVQEGKGVEVEPFSLPEIKGQRPAHPESWWRQ